MHNEIFSNLLHVGMCFAIKRNTKLKQSFNSREGGRGGGVLPYMAYIGMCRWEGYGFQAAYSKIGYIYQRIWF